MDQCGIEDTFTSVVTRSDSQPEIEVVESSREINDSGRRDGDSESAVI